MRRTGPRISRLLLLGACGAWALGCAEEPAAGGNTTSPTPAVAPANQPPELTQLRLAPATAGPDEPVEVLFEARDPEGGPLRFAIHWSLDGEPYGKGTRRLRLPATLRKGSEVAVQVVAYDERGATGEGRAWLELGNRPPELLALLLDPPETVRVDQGLRVVPSARDHDGDELEYRYRWYRNGEQIPRVDGPELAPGQHRRGDSIAVEVVASDRDDTSDALRSPPVTVVNSPPEIVSKPVGLGSDGSFQYELDVEDADGDRRLRYRLLEGPEGMEIDWLGGALHWMPRPDQTGSYRVAIEVDDQEGGTAVQSFEVTVATDELPAPPAAPASPAGL